MTRRELLEATQALITRTARRDVPYRKLGRTDVEVSCVGLGGAHVGIQANEADSIAIIRRALDEGINFLDNCWDYQHGQSELRMGRALRDGYRDRAFLMTKIDGRDEKSATLQIDESLRRLQTDHVDLLQLHEVIHVDDPERSFAERGAMAALQKAQRDGKARFLGFTGHKSPALHLKMLDAAKQHGFRFDAVQLPLNVMDAHFDSFEQKVLPVLVREGIAVLGMKPLGDNFIVRSGIVRAPEALRYSLSLPVSVLITGMDSLERVEQALDVARGFVPYTEEEIASLLSRTAAAAGDGALEQYKTSAHFDGTVEHPEWLG